MGGLKMKELDALFFRKHSVDPDDDAFMSEVLSEEYFGYEHDQGMDEENLEERDWLSQ
jgi:hypothetical protein